MHLKLFMHVEIVLAPLLRQLCLSLQDDLVLLPPQNALSLHTGETCVLYCQRFQETMRLKLISARVTDLPRICHTVQMLLTSCSKFCLRLNRAPGAVFLGAVPQCEQIIHLFMTPFLVAAPKLSNRVEHFVQSTASPLVSIPPQLQH